MYWKGVIFSAVNSSTPSRTLLFEKNTSMRTGFRRFFSVDHSPGSFKTVSGQKPPGKKAPTLIQLVGFNMKEQTMFNYYRRTVKRCIHVKLSCANIPISCGGILFFFFFTNENVFFHELFSHFFQSRLDQIYFQSNTKP